MTRDRRAGSWNGAGHPSEEELIRWMDGELPEDEARRVVAHAEACAACGARAQTLRRSSETLRAAASEIAVPDWLRGPPGDARVSRTFLLTGTGRARVRPPRSARARRAARWAAGASVVVTCGVALAAQPVRSRIAGLFERVLSAPPDSAAREHAKVADTDGSATVSFSARRPTFLIDVVMAQAGDSVRLRPISSSDVTVHVRPGTGAAVWSMPEGLRLSHGQGAPAVFTIDVGAGVTTVRLRIGERPPVDVSRAELVARGAIVLDVAPR